MATTCTFHGLVGIQNASRFQHDNKHFWRYDGYIALPDGDLAVAIFTFGANTASSEDGIYLMHARAMIGSDVSEEGSTTHALHFYAIDELQPLDDGNRALPMLIVAGKVSRSNFALEQDHGFDIDISQYVFAPQQNIRVRCYYPQGHPRLSKYRDIRTIGGITFNTFHEAACDFGLFENQNEGHLALQEAVQHLRTPAQLRFLFSQILLEGYAAMPL
ncbi:hypothetical protein F4604DRAFT_1922076 [Suillus subluteus]|nr:hypothetical protein F4604DRAFT_1922076 [Suillus subluteus]